LTSTLNPRAPLGSGRYVRHPGPGSYEVATFPENAPTSISPSPAAWSMASNTDPTRTNPEIDRLGPGAYQPQDKVCLPDPHSRSFSRNFRLDEGPGTQSRARSGKAPGPELDQQDSLRFRQSPRYTFGNTPKFFMCRGLWDENIRIGHQVPGPGDHCPSDSICSGVPPVSGPSYTIGEREHMSVDPTPGPGSYTKRTELDGPGCVFSKAAKGSTPGESLFVEETRSKSLPKGVSVAPGRRGAAPGPGRYQVTGITRRGGTNASAQGWSFGGRREFTFTPRWS